MMSIKIICSIVIIGCSTILGFGHKQVCSKSKGDKNAADGLCTAGERDNRLLNILPEAVSGISTAVRGGVRNLFSDFAGRLQNKTGTRWRRRGRNHWKNARNC